MKTMSPEELAAVNKMFDDIQILLDNLASRWLDEKEYEDIADYRAALRKAMPEAFVITRMIRRPFGCEVTYADMTFKLFATAKKIGWQRLG